MRNTHDTQRYLKNSFESLFTFGFPRLLNLIGLYRFFDAKTWDKCRKTMETTGSRRDERHKKTINRAWLFLTVWNLESFRFSHSPESPNCRSDLKLRLFSEGHYETTKNKRSTRAELARHLKDLKVNGVAFFSIWHTDCSETINLAITLEQSLSRWGLYFSSKDRQYVIRKVIQTGHGVEESSSKPQTGEQKN